MTYIENIFFCLAAPVLVAVFCTEGPRRRSLLFLLAGMTTCLLSSYINSFCAAALEAGALAAAVEIAPVIEEIMKLMPAFFFLLVYEPDDRKIAGEALMVAVGFATLENTCFLIINGANSTFRLLIRGFSTGAMHVACGAITAIGLSSAWDRRSLRVVSALGALCLAITWHGIYNVLVDQTGAAAWVGYALPVLTGMVVVPLRRRFFATDGE